MMKEVPVNASVSARRLHGNDNTTALRIKEFGLFIMPPSYSRRMRNGNLANVY
jgi:hypothetical protein